MANELLITAQLLLSTLLGGTIGFVREREKKSAGLRTHILVCLGSTLFMMISIYMSQMYSGDPGRIAAQVVTGIGFLGAGTILQAGKEVRGLTSAASIWVAAAIGMAVGCGFYISAVICTVIVLVIVEILREVEKRYIRPDKENQ